MKEFIRAGCASATLGCGLVALFPWGCCFLHCDDSLSELAACREVPASDWLLTWTDYMLKVKGHFFVSWLISWECLEAISSHLSQTWTDDNLMSSNLMKHETCHKTYRHLVWAATQTHCVQCSWISKCRLWPCYLSFGSCLQPWGNNSSSSVKLQMFWKTSTKKTFNKWKLTFNGSTYINHCLNWDKSSYSWHTNQASYR